jgi:hypothetical protein
LDDDNPPNGEDSDDYSDDEDFDEGSDEDSDDEDSDDEDSDEEDSDDEDSDEEVSDDSDSKSMAEEDHDDDLDYIEVKQVGGKYIKLKAAKATQNDDDEVQSKVMKDERFETNGKRGGARLAMVIVRAVSLPCRISSVDFHVLTLLFL